MHFMLFKIFFRSKILLEMNGKTAHLSHRPLFCDKSVKRFNARQPHIVVTAVASTNTEIHTPPTNKITQKDWESFTSSFQSQFTEHAFYVDQSQIEGELPKDIQGTFIRNGPGIFEIGGQRINQPFDGDGMLASFAFPGEGRPPFFCNRLVRTEAFVKEQQANKMIYRGAFSIGNPSGDGFYNPFDFSVKKVANTAVVHWAQKTMALYERDLPYHVSSPELRTIGQTDLNGGIDRPYFAAHHRIITTQDNNSKRRRRLVGFCAEEHGLLDCLVTVWEFDEDGKRVHKTSVVLPDAAFAFFHDMVVTEKHYIFIENPVQMDFNKVLTKYMFGTACIAECLKYDPIHRSTKIHVIARPSDDAAASNKSAPMSHHRTFISPVPFFSFHHGNAYESPSKDGRIVIDTIAYLDGFDFSSANLDAGVAYYNDSNVGRGTLARVVITPWESDPSKVVTVDRLMKRACEFPTVAPGVAGRKHRHMYMLGARFDREDAWGPPEAIVKVTTGTDDKTLNLKSIEQKIFHAGPEKWCGEPQFVPRVRPLSKISALEDDEDDEDDGYVMAVVFDASRKASELVVLDAKDLKEIARVKLGDVFLPSGLHGTWTSEYLGPPAASDGDAGAWYNARRGGGVKYDVSQGGPLRYE